MESATYPTDGGFFEALSPFKKNGISPEKRSPTEPYHTPKLGGPNQELKYSPNSLSKTEAPPAKGLYLPITKDNNQLISRSFEKSRNGDNVYDLGVVAQESNDGTDSGIEVIRALSSNGSNSDRFTPIQSCGSSLVSYSSEPEADRGSECGSESSERSRVRNGSRCSSQGSSGCWKSKKSYERSRVGRKTNGYDGTSESCSETSSTHEAVTPDQLTRSIDFKRSATSRLHESKKSEKGKCSTIRRSESSTRNNSHEKTSGSSHGSGRSSSVASKISSGYSSGRSIKSATAGKTEAKGTKTKADDGRWSQKAQTNGARIRVSSVADPSRRISPMSTSMTASFNGKTDGKSNALDKYGTLPRRPKRKSLDSLNLSIMHTSLSRSHSVTREPSLNRAANLRRQQSKEKENSSNCKTLPPYPRARRGTGKILIYHEVGVQTVITSEDISSSSAGVSIREKPTLGKENKQVQTEGKERLKTVEENYAKQCEETEKARKETEQLRLEKEKMVSRICKILGYPESEMKEDGLDELEKHFQAVGLTVMKQQEELSELRHYKVIAHRDLEKSLAAQKNLLQQQQEIEEEYSELQEFLQAEKTALSESLLDTEEELNRLRSEVAKKQSLLELQQEECKHLVRICEQRRQENLSLEAKLSGLDQRSRDVLVQQGAAVSAAAVALSGLGARLDGLVEQLSISCNIKEKDLEDVIFHNEAFNKTEDNSPEEFPSGCQPQEEPKRRESFIGVVLSAIKNAAQSSFALKKNGEVRKQSVADQNETFLDAEMEPNLNLENGLNQSPSLTETEPTKVEGGELSRSDSLQRLSDAILNRQMIEKNEQSVALDEIIPIEVNSLVDQIVDVDNLVTKLLKVIQIVQTDTERHVEGLREEREDLADQLSREKVNSAKLETDLQHLQLELTEARRELNVRIDQLEEAKALGGENQQLAAFEMQKRLDMMDSALGVLNSVQDVVDGCPQLRKLQLELKDCEFERRSEGDVNANSAHPTSDAQIVVVGDIKAKGTVLTTAI